MTRDEFEAIDRNPEHEGHQVPPNDVIVYPANGVPVIRVAPRGPAQLRRLRIMRLIPNSRSRRLYAIAVVQACFDHPKVQERLAFDEGEIRLQGRLFRLNIQRTLTAARLRFGTVNPGTKLKRELAHEGRRTIEWVRHTLQRLRGPHLRRQPGDLPVAMLSAVRDACDLAQLNDPADNLSRAAETAVEVLAECHGEPTHAENVERLILAGFAGAGWTFSPEYATSSVRALTRQIVTDDRLDLLPILADALQDAGVDEYPLRPLRAGPLFARGLKILEDLSEAMK